MSSKALFFSSGMPSNFHQALIIVYSPVMKSEMSFASNEHYFQVAKTFLLPNQSQRKKWHEAIRTAPTAKLAKRLGRKVPLEEYQLKDWNEMHALVAMLTCNLAKYTQNDDCREWLLSTAPRPLIEHRPDKVWGDGMDGTGRNLQGGILELVRARLI